MPSTQSGINTIDQNSLCESFGNICNTPLPYDHSASWEILVSKQILKNNDSLQIPIIFRVHHTLGDGVALLRLFLDTVADKEIPKKDYWEICSKSRSTLTNYLKCDCSYDNCMEFLFNWNFYAKYVRTVFLKIRIFISHFLQNILLILASPAGLINQAVYQKIDQNSLHQNELTGDKV